MFNRTRLALAALDAHATYADTEAGAAFDAKQAALTDAIAHAFVADTYPHNREDLVLDLCRHAGGLAWVRDIVSRHHSEAK